MDCNERLRAFCRISERILQCENLQHFQDSFYYMMECKINSIDGFLFLSLKIWLILFDKCHLNRVSLYSRVFVLEHISCIV